MKSFRKEFTVKSIAKSMILVHTVFAVGGLYALVSPVMAQEAPLPPLPPPPPPPPASVDENMEGSGEFIPPPPMPADSDSSPSSSGSSGSASSGPSAKAPVVAAKTAPGKKVPPGQDLVSIDFPEPTAIKDIIKAVSQWTGRNFIIGQNVSSGTKISIISPQQVTREEAYQAFLSALNVSGFTTVDTGKTVKIVPTRQATSSNIKTFYGAYWAPMTDEIITQIIPLMYIDAQTVSNQLRTILRESNPVPFQTTNSLIVSDTGHKIRRLLEIIKLLDVKANQPQAAIISIKNTDANDIAKKIQDIYGARAGGALYLQKVIVDERTNGLILLGPPRGLDDVVRLINRLDKPLEDAGSQNQIHVRPLDYADAEKLAATLQALAQGQASSRNIRRPGGAPGSAPVSGGISASVADIGGVKITADKPTNGLIIQGSRAAFKELDSIIKQLDRRKAQVYVESDIIDVNLGNQFQLNTSFLAGLPPEMTNSKASVPIGWKPAGVAPFAIKRDNLSGDQADSLIGKAIPSAALIGILGNKTFDIGGVKISPGAFIFALKQDSNSNVLQTPSLLVTDNEDANFEATERENVLVTSEDPTTKIRSQKYEALDATLGLKLKPQISKADYINLDLNIKAESFGRRSADNRPEQTNKRSFSTKITVQNTQTVVISGLQRDIEIEGKDKVPLLGDIPIIGWLFRNSSTSKSKTNLMIFITPYIVRNSEDLSRIYEKKVKERDEFLTAFYGKDFREREVFKRMPAQGRSIVPPPAERNTDTDAKPKSGGGPGSAGPDDSGRLPSQDPNPIVVPGSSGGGSSLSAPSGGGDIAPQPVPPPPDAP